MPSQPPLSTLSRSPSVPLRVPSHSSPSTLPPYPSPSLYVTFKVLQLVNTFRERVKTRVQSGRGLKKAAPTRITEDFCQDFERQAFEEIDRYLGRTSTVRTRKREYPIDLSPLTSESEGKPNQAKPSAVATVKETAETEPSQSIQWLLDELNQSVKSNRLELIAVAKDHELFLQRKDDFEIKPLSVKELIQQLVTVRDLLSTLRRKRHCRSQVRTLAEGNELLDLSLDESQTANLEHLLLCLREQLTRLLVSKLLGLVRKHLVECQRDQHRHCEEWFFEFPDARHPLSTTWPWSIRPSLAVLWGVCWMFYDRPANYDPFFDDDLYASTAETIQSMLQFASPAPQQFAFYPGQGNFRQGLRNLHAPTADPRLPRSFPASHSPSGRPVMMTTQPHQTQHGGLTAGSSSHPFYTSSGAPDQAANAGQGLAGTDYLYSSAAPPASYAPASAQPDPSQPDWWVPQVNFAPQQHPSFVHDSARGADDGRAWNSLESRTLSGQQQLDQTSWTYPPAHLPPNPLPHPRNASAPSIRVTTELPQPQDFNASPAALSASSSTQFPESSHQAFNPHHLSPQARRGNFMNPEGEMQHTPPVSPLPNQAPATMGEQMSRKRSHEQMMEAAGGRHVEHHSGGHSRTGSVSSQHLDQSAGEGGIISPKTRTLKRGDAPMNAQGKFICTNPECQDQIFDRKCEWSKHMDKHDRPYRCEHAECAKLQGFTYSGGLLRHEREVHNKHGGPKAQLMCPHEDCKRHGGKGFTRKENLNEHLRRVHQGRDPQSQGFSQPDMNGVTEDMHPPYFTHPTQEDADSPMHKRRRYTQGASDRSASEGIEDLRQEVVRLREENGNKENEMDRMRIELQELRQMVQLMRDSQTQQSHQN